LEEHIASIFRVEEKQQQQSSVKIGGFFDPEDRGNMFPQNTG
jgi:hypothetical protein